MNENPLDRATLEKLIGMVADLSKANYNTCWLQSKLDALPQEPPALPNELAAALKDWRQAWRLHRASSSYDAAVAAAYDEWLAKEGK